MKNWKIPKKISNGLEVVIYSKYGAFFHRKMLHFSSLFRTINNGFENETILKFTGSFQVEFESIFCQFFGF